MTDRQRHQQSVGGCIDVAASIGAGKGAIPDNRRNHNRHPYNKLAPVVWLGPHTRSDRVAQIRVSDISVGGVRVVDRQMLYPGSVGVLQLTRTNGDLALVGLRVVHTSYIGHMRYTSGCVFMPIPDEHLPFFVVEGRIIKLEPGERFPPDQSDLRAA